MRNDNVSGEYEDRLQKALQELRDMYDNKIQQGREDFEKIYEDKVHGLHAILLSLYIDLIQYC